MSIDYLKEIINKNLENISFIIGNGVHLHFQTGAKSWSELLLYIYNKYRNDTMDPIFTEIPDSISFTEFFDFLGSTEDHKRDIQMDLANELIHYPATDAIKSIVNKAKENNLPILTTNMDLTFSKSIDANLYHIRGSKFTDFYPWSSYYSDAELTNPNDGFGIWHINGMANYHRSIKFGLTHYMGNVERARTMIYKGDDSLYAKDNHGQLTKQQGPWDGDKTWLDIFFNKVLIIFGLGLGKDEVFLRWLLIERFKYNRKYNYNNNKSYYIDKTGTIDDGKKFFLKKVGIDVKEIDNYKTLYEDIW